MIVVTDSTALTLLVNPGSKPPTDPNTNAPLEDAEGRIELLVRRVDQARGTLLVPTPVLAEVLVKAGDAAPEILAKIGRSARFKVADFDTRAAVELSVMTREAMGSGDKRGGSTAPWQKVKFDRQIVAIARVNGATEIYSDDGELAKFARKLGLTVVPTWEMDRPEQPEPNLFEAFGVSAAPLPKRAINLGDDEQAQPAT